MKSVESYVRSIPDFPEPGIIFRDITSVLNDADGLQLAIVPLVIVSISLSIIPWIVSPSRSRRAS